MYVFSSLFLQVEMFFDPRVVLYLFNDGIQNIFTDVKIGFQKRDEVLTIVRVYPDAPLNTQEARFAHGSA